MVGGGGVGGLGVETEGDLDRETRDWRIMRDSSGAQTSRCSG